jgi:hypothetical protein
MVGTLSTLSTLMTPFGGNDASGVPVFKLAINGATLHERCVGIKQSTLGLKVEPKNQSYVTAQVQGHLCSTTGGLKAIQFSIALPSDLTDQDFLEHLPANSCYVISGLPSPDNTSPEPLLHTRVKITRGTTEGSLTPITIEWLPDEAGLIQHPPMTVWISKSHLNSQLPWQKVKFAELGNLISQPLDVAGEIKPTSDRSILR